MKCSRILFKTLLTLSLFSTAFAHHSGSVFDRDRVIAVEGFISQFHWGNPHVYIYVEAQTDLGNFVEWEIETDATPILSRSGWAHDTLQTGDPVVVRMNPVHDTRRTHARLVSLSKQDGSIWSARSSFAGSTSDLSATEKTDNISGTWATPLATNAHLWFLRDNMRKLTTQGAEIQAAYDITSDSPAGKCIAYPTPTFLGVPYLNEIKILDDRIVIRGELYNTERTIYTDGRDHPEDGKPTNQGHSIGRWENDVLIVETALLEEHRSSLIDGSPMGIRRRITEKFRLGPDQTRLLIDFRVEDPDYLAEPFQGTLEWVHMPQLEIIGIDCDPEVSTRAWGSR